jgi:6-pyruvoyl-tetrahydropterin synthase
MEKQIKNLKSQSPKNVFRTKWSTNLDAKVVVDVGKQVKLTPLKVLQKFDHGLIYESAGKNYMLSENVFGLYPFLLVFELSSSKFSVTSTYFNAVPENLIKVIAPACEKLAQTVKVPETLHNVEAEITQSLRKAVKLPEGIELSKAIIKLGRTNEVACDCDVDGPCGYCCDTCDCNTCKYEDVNIDPIEFVMGIR